jgi:membrane protein
MRGLLERRWPAILVRSARAALADGVTDLAAALAYYAFLAVPAVGLVTLGVFTVVAGEDTVDSLLDSLEGVVPAEAISLLDQTLTRALDNQTGGVALIVVGGVVALWTATSAMGALMRGLNRVYGRTETRTFARRRLIGLVMLAWALVALALVLGLLVLGPQLSEGLGEWLDAERAVSWFWWAAEWPILLGGLLVSFGAVFYLGPDVEPRRLRLVTPGAFVAIAIWLVASAGFAFYVDSFGSYNKAWGSLAGVIVVLTWLWLSSLALLLGAEVNAEAERGPQPRNGRARARNAQGYTGRTAP